MQRWRKLATSPWTAVAVLLVAGGAAYRAAESNFSRTTIDLGVCVSDIDAAAAFYTQAMGFEELEGFDVPGDFAADAGLFDNHGVHIRVFVLGEGESATKLKLLHFADAPGQKIDNEFVHNSYGFRYLTIFVNDIDAAVEQAAAAGAKPIAKGPVQLPANLNPDLYLAVYRDPDGNMVELVGPKAGN